MQSRLWSVSNFACGGARVSRELPLAPTEVRDDAGMVGHPHALFFSSARKLSPKRQMKNLAALPIFLEDALHPVT